MQSKWRLKPLVHIFTIRLWMFKYATSLVRVHLRIRICCINLVLTTSLMSVELAGLAFQQWVLPGVEEAESWIRCLARPLLVLPNASHVAYLAINWWILIRWRGSMEEGLGLEKLWPWSVVREMSEDLPFSLPPFIRPHLLSNLLFSLITRWPAYIQ
jgi:hypothetical protein